MDELSDTVPAKKLRLSEGDEFTSDVGPITSNGDKTDSQHRDYVEVKTDSQKTVDYSMGSDLDSQGLDQGDTGQLVVRKQQNGGEVGIQSHHESDQVVHSDGVETDQIGHPDGLGTDQIGHPDCLETDQKKPTLTKIESVIKDAKLIASIISDTDVEKIYENLKSKRRNPNRVDVVMNDILENAGIYQKTRNSKQEDTSSLLLADFVSVIDKAMANMESLPLTAEEIQHLLQEEGNRPDRVDRVFAKILRQVYLPKQISEEDVRMVITQMPDANPEEVKKLLSDTQGQGQADRVKHVISVLKNNTVASLRKDDSIPHDPTISNDPLFKDMQIVKKVVPHRDPNEIYAYLEAHYDKKNRIKLVIEELMGDEVDPEDHDGGEAGSTSKPSVPGVGELEEELQELKDIFPDCDPNYLYNALEDRKDDKDRVKNLAIRMLEKKDYPKLKEMLDNENKLKKKQKIIKATFNMKEFLAKFPDPEQFFCDKNKAVSNNYKKHVSVQLQNDFRRLSEEYLQQIMEANNSCLTLCKRTVLTNIRDLGDFMAVLFMPTQRPLILPFPEEPDELFFNEMLYLRHETEIQNHLQEQKTLKDVRREEAGANGELLPCECCFDDECLFEDMTSCQDGHLFCKECVRRSSEVVIGDSKCVFPCLTDDCDYQFPLPVLQAVMSPNMFSILLRRMQEEEVKQAAIPDLVSCPFCSFATIISNPDDKVFKCLNPECLKESCRLCGEPSHIPLQCDEVEKQGETDMRTYIETRVTEAMLRKCHKCHKRFIKETGCNKMTCTCGATQCYFCREEDIGYDHFNSDRKCSNREESTVIHVKEMEAAATEARRQYLEDHPQAKDLVLKYDPVAHIQDVKNNHNYMWGDGDNENEYSENDEEYNSDYD